MSKASKHLRECPAAGRAISSRECGEGRQSIFQCPEMCPHNPFSIENYDDFSEIEGRVIQKTIEFFSRENRGNPAALANHAEAMRNGIATGTSYAMWHFFWLRDDAGKTMVERWEARRFDGLTNDERFVVGMHRQAMPALLEVMAVPDDVRVEGVDWLSGRRVTIVDRSLARKAVRFDAIFAWMMPGPHYHRFLGAAMLMPEIGPLDPLQILRDTGRHLGAPADAEGELRWLAEHWVRVSRALEEIGAAITHTMYASVDAKFYRTDYRLTRGHEALIARLHKDANIAPGALSEKDVEAGFIDCYDWLEPERAEDATQPELPALSRIEIGLPGRQVIGTVLLGVKTVRIEASSAARNAELRRKFEKLAAGLVEFHSEKVEDVGAQMAAKHPYDAKLVPPHFIEQMPRIQLSTSVLPSGCAGTKEETEEMVRSHQAERWPETPIPALGGLTPRQAAASAEQRPALIRLVKGMVRRADRKSHQASVDATKLVELLGLHEIASATPPERPALYEKDDADSESAGFSDDPPVERIGEREVERRLQMFIEEFPMHDFKKLDDAFDSLADDLLEFYETVVLRTLSDFEDQVLYLTLARLYFVIVPAGTEREVIDSARLSERFEARIGGFIEALDDALANGSSEDDPLSPLFERCRQPLAAFDAVNVLMNAGGGDGKDSISPSSMPVMLAFIAAAADELDCCVAEAR